MNSLSFVHPRAYPCFTLTSLCIFYSWKDFVNARTAGGTYNVFHIKSGTTTNPLRRRYQLLVLGDSDHMYER
jgi:hypothetical protein